MKKLVVIFICFIFIGCAHYPSMTKLNTLKPGINRAELATLLDKKEPYSVDLINGYYLLKYFMFNPQNNAAQKYYFVFDQNDHLIGWEEVKGQNKIIAGGVSILIPFPS